MKKALAALLCLLPAPAIADEPADALRLYVEREAGPGRVELSVGKPSNRLQLAPCAEMEPFVPPGARLWGRTTLGVRCVSGATWQAFLPVHVRIYGQAQV